MQEDQVRTLSRCEEVNLFALDLYRAGRYGFVRCWTGFHFIGDYNCLKSLGAIVMGNRPRVSGLHILEPCRRQRAPTCLYGPFA